MSSLQKTFPGMVENNKILFDMGQNIFTKKGINKKNFFTIELNYRYFLNLWKMNCNSQMGDSIFPERH